ncbi:MAG: outer membrane beta-barrel protein [Candidatus Acidiferrum sp.]|jgi:hypothetical protein
MCQAFAGAVVFLVVASAACGQEAGISIAGTETTETRQTFGANPSSEIGGSMNSQSAPVMAARKNAHPDGGGNGRWELSFGADYVKFQSPTIHANTVGTNTSGSYAVSDQFGVECAVATAFGREIYDREHVKLLIVDCGPRIVWGARKVARWGHVLAGWSHLQPQTAGNSRSAFSIVAGGGADYRVKEGFSLRVEANYVRTTFFNSSQNNIQAGVGVVYHF